MTRDASLAEKWISFLNEVDDTRRRLRCTQSPAWFRGQSNDAYQLDPTLFRFGAGDDPDDSDKIRSHLSEIAKFKDAWLQSLQQKTNYKKKLQNCRDDSELTSEYGTRYKRNCELASQEKEGLAEARRKLRRFTAPINGERELFDEFIFRSGRTAVPNSWETLAEMRHYGVPTRLLDWTDRLDIALFFALEKYRTALLGHKLGGRKGFEEAITIVSELPRPCVWVLNPYLLSKRAANRTAIWNLALDSNHDYYSLLLQSRQWPYDEPLPTYPPAPMERVRAQRGYFTVFGNDKSSLNLQVKNGVVCLAKITISPEAAVFSLDYLTRVQGLSQFEVYRDLDSLGQELTERLVRIQRLK